MTYLRGRKVSGGKLVVSVVGELLYQESEVIADEPPFERATRLLVVAIEGGEAGRDVGEVGEVARGEDLSLDDDRSREVDPDTWSRREAWTGSWTNCAFGQRAVSGSPSLAVM